MSQETKICSRCKKEKPLTDYLDKKGGRENKACSRCLALKRAKVKLIKEREIKLVNVSYRYWEK